MAGHSRHKIGNGPKRIDAMARRLRREFKREGLPIQDAVDHAMRQGFLRQDAVTAAAKAYRVDPFQQRPRFVQGGAVSPR